MVLTLRKVLISDEVDAKCIEVLKSNGIDVEKNTKLTKEQLVAEIPVSFYLSDHTLRRVSGRVHIWGPRQGAFGHMKFWVLADTENEFIYICVFQSVINY